MRIVYARRALCDIDEILGYVHRRSPRGAHGLSLAIEHAVNMCALHPQAAAKTDEPDVYRCPLARFRYTLYYRPLSSGNGIEVIRVVHSARITSLGTVPADPVQGDE